MKKYPKKNILLIHMDFSKFSGTVTDHYRSFAKHGHHHYRAFVPDLAQDLIEHGFCDRLNSFDAIVLHYSIYYPEFKANYPKLVEFLSKFENKKIVFVQDEYRRVNETCDILLEMKVDDVYSVCLEDARKQIYFRLIDSGIRLHTTLTGYVPDKKYSFVPLHKRDWDVSYRARGLKQTFPWLGLKAFEKSDIAEKFQAKNSSLKLNISTAENERVYGKLWTELLRQSRATLITISGASIVDFDGSIEYELRQLLLHEGATSEQIISKVEKYDGNINATAISPRVFEAANCHTALVGFRDHYNGILEPGVDYVVLERDFSNIEQVIDTIKNDTLITNIINNAHKKLISSEKFTWKKFVRDFEDQQFNDVEKDSDGTQVFLGRHFWLQHLRNVKKWWYLYALSVTFNVTLTYHRIKLRFLLKTKLTADKVRQFCFKLTYFVFQKLPIPVKNFIKRSVKRFSQ